MVVYISPEISSERKYPVGAGISDTSFPVEINGMH